MRTFETDLKLETETSFSILDITEDVRRVVRDSGIVSGMVTVTSMHTTCAVSVNEHEERLLDDIARFFLELVPPGRSWKHNDLHLRENIPPDEPRNAHAHLIAMMLGNGVTLAVRDEMPVLGRYQSLLFIDLDGPRNRSAAVQVIGTAAGK